MPKIKPVESIKGFAAFDSRGEVLWATVRASKDESAALLRRFNPPVEGFDYPWQVLPISITIDSGYQYDIEDVIGQGTK